MARVVPLPRAFVGVQPLGSVASSISPRRSFAGFHVVGRRLTPGVDGGGQPRRLTIETRAMRMTGMVAPF
jgi:hypothetical protein